VSDFKCNTTWEVWEEEATEAVLEVGKEEVVEEVVVLTDIVTVRR
jgi:hypothetical protein